MRLIAIESVCPEETQITQISLLIYLTLGVKKWDKQIIEIKIKVAVALRLSHKIILFLC